MRGLQPDVRSEFEGALQAALTAAGTLTRVHYPVPSKVVFSEVFILIFNCRRGSFFCPDRLAPAGQLGVAGGGTGAGSSGPAGGFFQATLRA